MPERFSLQKAPETYVLATLLLVSALLLIIAGVRLHEYSAIQTDIARDVVSRVSAQIGTHLAQQRHKVGLFVSNEEKLLEAILVDPEDEGLRDELYLRINDYFSSAVSLLVSDLDGCPVSDGFAVRIGKKCRDDIRLFGENGEYSIRLHPDEQASHYPLLVKIEPEFILRVGFHPDSLRVLLRAAQPHRHRLLLVTNEEGGSVELTSDGSPEDLGIDPTGFYSDTEKLSLARQQVPGTAWTLVDARDSSLYSDYLWDFVLQGGPIYLCYLVVSLIMVRVIRRSESNRQRYERIRQRANEELERKVHERTRQLRESKELAEVTLGSISDGVITTDSAGKVTSINSVAQKLTGWNSQAALGSDLSEVLRPIDGESAEDLQLIPRGRCLDQSEMDALRRETVSVVAGEQALMVQISAAPIGENAHPLGAVLVMRDVTEEKKLARRISWQASHDHLTGFINRHEFERRLRDSLERIHSDEAQHALLYLDLDRFKVINDTCGHLAGDELLRQIAKMMQAKVRRNDTLARLGGDEFALLLEYCPLDQALKMGELLRDTVREFRFGWEDKSFALGVSIGLVVIDKYFCQFTNVLSAADSACYAAKQAGRNRVRVYREEYDEIGHQLGDMQWVSQIRTALKKGRFQIHFQRIIPVAAGQDGDVHFEALLRMIDERGRAILPGAFLPAAERFDLMPSIDRLVIDRILDWLGEGKVKASHIGYCAINLSAQSVRDPDFVGYVENRLKKSSVAPDKICFELPEAAVLANLSETQRFASILSQYGCRFSLDDFGGGMSSLTYLRQLPIDFIKIDGHLVKGVVEDPVIRAMFDAIIGISHAVGVQTIAECVETDAVLAALKELGVDYAQGYGIAEPGSITLAA